MRRFFSYLSHIVFPQHCPVCGRLSAAYCPGCLRGAAEKPLPPFCADCGGAMRIPAATASDIDDICCKNKLVIHGQD